MSKPEEHLVRLRALREELGVSQKTLAKRTGFQAPEISHWETGRRTIKLWQFEALLNGMGYQLDWSPMSGEK